MRTAVNVGEDDTVVPHGPGWGQELLQCSVEPCRPQSPEMEASRGWLAAPLETQTHGAESWLCLGQVT